MTVRVATQRQLQEYLRIDAARRELAAKQENLRQQLISHLTQRGRVESGQLVCYVQNVERRTLSQRKLIDAVGPAECDHILSLIEPTVSQRLIVRPRQQPSGDDHLRCA